MEDITQYSDNELSLQVFNTEDLYNIRHTDDFIVVLSETYKYTPSQLQVLVVDLADDKDEMEAYNG